EFSTVRYHKEWVEEIISQAEHRGSKIVLDGAIDGVDKNSELSLELLAKVQKIHLKARAHNGELRTDALRDEWDKAHEANPGKRDWQISDKVNVDEAALAPKLKPEIAVIKFKVDPPVTLDFTPRDIKEAKGQSRLKDDTVINGTLLVSPMVFHNVDAIDFQYLAMEAVKKGVDPMVAIESSWLIQNSPFAREAWEWHRQEVVKLEQRLEKQYGLDANGKPYREPTLKERYRIGWKNLRDKAQSEGKPSLGFWKGTIGEEFVGPNYDLRGHETFPELEVPRKQIAFESKFTPSWNTYYAIYFTITGLHGLHVIGGALVLAYYLFFSRRMYETNPEWLANRVEVGGLFWHFVDLIWIFAFPIFYLM
ncbi:MAG TPA: cytochrome c oxidase subunit 3, partial [Luteolibacter sp.]|nr:cytochrome c oxidase subunit 3 [Luteolibacter sp.]